MTQYKKGDSVVYKDTFIADIVDIVYDLQLGYYVYHLDVGTGAVFLVTAADIRPLKKTAPQEEIVPPKPGWVKLSIPKDWLTTKGESDGK